MVDFSGATWVDKMGKSIALYRLGEPVKAYRELELVTSQELDFLTYKSSLLLSLGEVEEAEKLLKLISEKETSANVLAQKALIDLVMNERKKV